MKNFIVATLLLSVALGGVIAGVPEVESFEYVEFGDEVFVALKTKPVVLHSENVRIAVAARNELQKRFEKHVRVVCDVGIFCEIRDINRRIKNGENCVKRLLRLKGIYEKYDECG